MPTMSFLWPAGLGFLGLIPGILILYFLRLKRDVRVVSSTYLWKKTVDAYRVNRPFQRFQNHLLLWLQLLAVLLLALAASRPYIEQRQRTSGIHLVLIDQSASMSTREEGGRTRLDLARDFCRELIAGLPGGDRMMVIGFSDRPLMAAPLTSERGALLRGVDAVHPTERPTRIEEAWQTALSVARQFDLSDIYLLSDGGFRALPQLTEAHANVHFIPFGKTWDNLGIVHLETRESDEAQRRVEIFARVANRRDQSVQATVELRVADRLIDARSVEIGAGEEQGVVFERAASEQGMAEVRITGLDAFASDDRAWIPLGGAELVRVVLVGEENVFLKQALAMNPRIELTVVPPADFAKVRGSFRESDLIVFDGADSGPMEQGTCLYLGVAPSAPGFGGGKEVENPTLLKWDAEHPLTRYINFSTLHIGKAVEVSVPSWGRTLLSSDRGPIISVGERGGLRVACVAFRILDSDWPLRVSFPIFFANAVRWAREEDPTTADRIVRPGQPLSIRAPREPQSGKLTDPSGTVKDIAAAGSDRIRVAETERPGVYRMKWEKRPTETLYAVSLTDPGESDIRVPDKIDMGGTQLQAREGSAFVRVEFAAWLALLGLAVLIIEWLVYQYSRSRS
ncbi:MAG TPA: BatA and WFA domain-containing protein [Planctomycetota bacterium]|nr:BatA and WFA domain-containing protein [Planctomycetota bacterium]